MIIDQAGKWATWDWTKSDKKALLVFSTAAKAEAFFKGQGSGPAKAIEVLNGDVRRVIETCEKQGVKEFVLDVSGTPEGAQVGLPISDLVKLG